MLKTFAFLAIQKGTDIAPVPYEIKTQLFDILILAFAAVAARQ
jgi:hypothetical protein